MKHTLMTLLLAVSTIAYGESIYSCQFQLDDGEKKVKIEMTGNDKAKVILEHNGTKSLNNCKADKDEIGLLVDCSTKKLDFMILLNNEIGPPSGGIMSSTYDLYADIDC